MDLKKKQNIFVVRSNKKKMNKIKYKNDWWFPLILINRYDQKGKKIPVGEFLRYIISGHVIILDSSIRVSIQRHVVRQPLQIFEPMCLLVLASSGTLLQWKKKSSHT